MVFLFKEDHFKEHIISFQKKLEDDCLVHKKVFLKFD